MSQPTSENDGSTRGEGRSRLPRDHVTRVNSTSHSPKLPTGRGRGARPQLSNYAMPRGGYWSPRVVASQFDVGVLAKVTKVSAVLVQLNSQTVTPSGHFFLKEITFTTENFCDRAVVDLTSVLKVGFALKYQGTYEGVVLSQFPILKYSAQFVCPLQENDPLSRRYGSIIETIKAVPEIVALRGLKSELSTFDASLEQAVILHILQYFQYIQKTECPINSLLSYISNSLQRELTQYVGSSAHERRQFIEDRSYIFSLLADGTVCLISAAHHIACTCIADILRYHGQCMSLQMLFDLFHSRRGLPIEVSRTVAASKSNFVEFLQMHPRLFAVFPSRVFVSLRRPLISVDYQTFLINTCGSLVGSRLLVNNSQRANSYSFSSLASIFNSSTTVPVVSTAPLLHSLDTNQEDESFDTQRFLRKSGPDAQLSAAFATALRSICLWKGTPSAQNGQNVQDELNSTLNRSVITSESVNKDLDWISFIEDLKRSLPK